jgi:hypothetical protein
VFSRDVPVDGSADVDLVRQPIRRRADRVGEGANLQSFSINRIDRSDKHDRLETAMRLSLTTIVTVASLAVASVALAMFR